MAGAPDEDPILTDIRRKLEGNIGDWVVETTAKETRADLMRHAHELAARLASDLTGIPEAYCLQHSQVLWLDEATLGVRFNTSRFTAAAMDKLQPLMGRHSR